MRAVAVVGVVLMPFLAPGSPQQRRTAPSLDECRPPGFTLATGTLGADQGGEGGYYTVGEMTLLVPVKGIPAQRLQERMGERGTLVWVPEERK